MSTALVKPDPSLSPATLEVMLVAAQKYVASGLLPKSITKPEQALLIMTVGRELGIPATYALRNIHVIEGRPTCSAELMLALIRRDYGQAAIRVKATDAKACTIEYRQNGWDGTSTYSFTIEEAAAAGLAGKATWKSYPAAMLRARAVSAVARFAFPECIAGLYTPEELGAEVAVSADGQQTVIVDVAPRAATQRIDRATGEITEAVPKEDPDKRMKLVDAFATVWGHAAHLGLDPETLVEPITMETPAVEVMRRGALLREAVELERERRKAPAPVEVATV